MKITRDYRNGDVPNISIISGGVTDTRSDRGKEVTTLANKLKPFSARDSREEPGAGSTLVIKTWLVLLVICLLLTVAWRSYYIGRQRLAEEVRTVLAENRNRLAWPINLPEEVGVTLTAIDKGFIDVKERE